MNEFDVVRGIGADTPDPEAATTSAARARLLAAIHAEAATGGSAVTDTAVDPGARRLARTSRRPHRRRRLLPASAAIAAMLAAALAVPLILHHPTPPTRQGEPGTGVAGDVLAPAEPAAVKLLTTAAVAAARTHEPPLGPGQYWYVRERGTQVGTNNDEADWPKSFHWRMPYENQTWWAIDGDTRHRETFGRPQFLSPADRAAWVANGRPKLPGQKVRTFDENPGTSDRSDGYLPLTYKQILDLPTDPARLTDALSKRIYAGQPNGSCPMPPGSDVAAVRCHHRPVTNLDRYGAIVFLVTNYPLPAELRSALYQALTRLDGIELTGEVTDLAGRRGVGVTMSPLEEQLMPQRTVLIFDPASGRLLGSRSVLAADVPSKHLTRGTIMEESTILEMSVVDSPTARPKNGR